VGNWEGTEVGRRIILKRILEKRYGVVMIDWSGSGYRQVVGSFEQGNEPLSREIPM
jgi:hypothetical protein